MDVVVHIPDDASLDQGMAAFTSARAAFAEGFNKIVAKQTYLRIEAGNVFHSENEYNDWIARVAARDANLAGGVDSQSVLKDSAIDVRELGGDRLRAVGLFINEVLNHSDKIGPTSVMHKLSGLLDYGIQKADGQDELSDDVATIVAADELPETGKWTVNEAKSIKYGNWNWMTSPEVEWIQGMLAAIRA